MNGGVGGRGVYTIGRCRRVRNAPHVQVHARWDARAHADGWGPMHANRVRAGRQPCVDLSIELAEGREARRAHPHDEMRVLGAKARARVAPANLERQEGCSIWDRAVNCTVIPTSFLEPFEHGVRMRISACMCMFHVHVRVRAAGCMCTPMSPVARGTRAPARMHPAPSYPRARCMHASAHRQREGSFALLCRPPNCGTFGSGRTSMQSPSSSALPAG